MTPYKRIATVLLATLWVGGSIPAIAHHGFTGAYDASRPVFIEGIVQSVTVAYPHAEMTVQVTGRPQVPSELPQISNLGIADVTTRIVAAAPGTYFLQIAGLQQELQGRIANGDRIALVALRNCLPPNQHRSRWIRLASGEVVSVAGRMQTEVQNCQQR